MSKLAKKRQAVIFHLQYHGYVRYHESSAALAAPGWKRTRINPKSRVLRIERKGLDGIWRRAFSAPYCGITLCHNGPVIAELGGHQILRLPFDDN